MALSERMVNDYKHITFGPAARTLAPQDTRSLHVSSRRWLAARSSASSASGVSARYSGIAGNGGPRISGHRHRACHTARETADSRGRGSPLALQGGDQRARAVGIHGDQ